MKEKDKVLVALAFIIIIAGLITIFIESINVNIYTVLLFCFIYAGLIISIGLCIRSIVKGRKLYQ